MEFLSVSPCKPIPPRSASLLKIALRPRSTQSWRRRGNESPMTEEKISSIKIGAAFAWNETNHSNKSAIAHDVDGIRGYLRLFIEYLASSSLSPRTIRRLMLGYQ